MKLFGLIGHPLSHSFSKKYFTEKFKKEGTTDCSYELYDIPEVSMLTKIIDNTPNLLGLNVTIPYKEKVIELMDKMNENASLIGAVNTIKIDPISKKTTGYNTDYYGFKKSLKPFLNNNHERALILGTGGASKAIIYALKELNIDYLLVSRNPKEDNEISYDAVNNYVIKHHQLIINTTPIGTFPNVNESPSLPYNLLTNNHLLYDLVYNPSETIFLKNGKINNCITINGAEMLKLQAEKAWEIWNNKN